MDLAECLLDGSGLDEEAESRGFGAGAHACESAWIVRGAFGIRHIRRASFDLGG